jgi:TonB-linked SusC/RagA family outer membrane protein
MGQILTKTVLVFTGYLIFLILFNPAISKAEDDRGGITIRQQNAPIEKVFQSIEKQSGYRFFYNETLLQGAGKVTINLQNVSLQEALNACFYNQPLSYAIVDKTIIVKRRQEQQPKAPEAAVAALSAPGKIIALRGKVTSGNVPVSGASIMIKGTDNGASTDKDGLFTLPEVEDDATLVISSVSHTAREIRLNGQAFIAIDLSQKSIDLDEAVVVAYNTTTRRMNTGSVAVVNGEQIQSLPNRSFDRSLQGYVPGLLVTPSTGQPGGGVSNFILRGISTATQPPADNVGSPSLRNPLIVIDGVPVGQDFGQLNSTSAVLQSLGREGNPLAQLNPSDIETITVLKDAAAVALYGARASNGVILVTTKRGKAGKTTFNFRHQTDISTRIDGKTEMLNQEEYIQLLTDTYNNTPRVVGGISRPYTDTEVLSVLRGKFPVIVNAPGDTSFYEPGDWYDAIYKDHASTISNELSMSGGNDKNNFYLNLENTKQDGIVRNTGFDRSSIRFNFENRPSSWLKLGLNSTFSYTIQDYLRGASFSAAPISPLNPVRSIDGNYILNYPAGIAAVSLLYANPAAVIDYNIYRNASFRGLNKIYGEVSFLKNFKISSSLGVDFILTEAKEKWDPRLNDGTNFPIGTGRVEEADSRRANLITSNILRYDKLFGKHSVGVIVGQEAQILSQKDISIQATNLSSPYYDQVSSPGVTITSNTGALRYKETLQSLFSQLNYSFSNRYFLSGSVRRDGSSRFGDDRRYGTYWSVGGGWDIAAERFAKSALPWMNYFKIRGSIGAAGNAGAINTLTRFDKLQNYTYLGGAAVTPSGLPSNPDVQWEQTFTWDAGIESRFWNERIAITADVYNRTTSDLIYSINLPQNTGFGSILANVGKMANKGIELSLSARIIKSANFLWSLNANWSTNQNKLIKANVPLATTISSSTLVANKEGEVFNSFFMPRWAGVDPEDGAPQWLDSTDKITKTYNANNSVFVGKVQPDGFGAIINTIAYKSFELSAMLYYQYGFQIYNSRLAEISTDGNNPYFLNEVKDALNYWQKKGDESPNPRRVAGNLDGGTRASTRYLFDGDYIRLQNVSLSYNLPRSLVTRLKLSNVKAYVQGNNLAVWTKYPDLDPGLVTGNGYSMSTLYPLQRSFTLGLNVNF